MTEEWVAAQGLACLPLFFTLFSFASFLFPALRQAYLGMAQQRERENYCVSWAQPDRQLDLDNDLEEIAGSRACF